MISVRAEGGPPVLVGNTEVWGANVLNVFGGEGVCKVEILFRLLGESSASFCLLA